MAEFLSLFPLLAAYRSGEIEASTYLNECLAKAKADQHNCWISLVSQEQLAEQLTYLADKQPQDLPLYGVPFAVKDNIDFAQLPTTAACKEYEYQPADSAFVVAKLLEAGAIVLGKTNLDQFATGLVGTRSPWGATKNSFNSEYISGGSSAGSAVAVATGQVCFALGTDTAGSGRVPAALNNILGLKASKGLLSCSGVVPACRSLDCVTLFSHDADELNLLLDICAQFDPQDSYARPNVSSNALPAYQQLESLAGKVIGLPKAEQLEFFGNQDNAELFEKAKLKLVELGAELKEIDFAPFTEAALLLYQGPWVAERFAAIEAFFEEDSGRCLPVIETIVGGAQGKTAVDAFKASYQLQACARLAEQQMQGLDAVLTPTAGSTYTINEVNADPIQLNSNMGWYTNFMNLLDYSAIALPAGFGSNGLPFGITLFAPAFKDRSLLSLARCIQRSYGFELGATGQPLALAESLKSAPAEGWVELAVCGAHLEGMPLNHQLTERGGRLVKATATSANYKLYALAGGPPYRPGLQRVSEQGQAIAVEVWQLPLEHLGSFLLGIPAPLGLGKAELADGTWVCSFICESHALSDATDISEFGGWRAYQAQLAN